MTCHLIIRVIAAIAVIIPPSLAFATQPEPMGDIDQSFLLKAVEGQHAEVAFGQSAIQKASDDQVKQYGARMIQDHEKASQEGRQLAAKEGVRLPSQLSMEHQQSQQKLSQLSGKEFDKAYISLMVQEHMKDLGDFQRGAQTLNDPPARQWAQDTLPILMAHLESAKAIAARIGAATSEIDVPFGAFTDRRPESQPTK
jgi:putative membrane protein